MSEKALTGKDVVKRITPVAIAIVLIAIIALIVSSVKSCSNRKPTIENSDDVYLELGDLKITNDRLYTYMKQNYGTSELLRLVDEKLYAEEMAKVTNEDLDKFIYNSVYSVEDINEFKGDPQDNWEDIIDSLLMNNLINAADVDEESEKDVTNKDSKLWSVVRSYYKLQYARQEWAKQAYLDKVLADRKAEGKEGMFDADQITTRYEEKFTGAVQGIFIPYTSEKAALDAMKRFGINTNSTILTKNGWVTGSLDYNNTYELKDEDYLTPAQVYDALIKMYNEVYAYAGKEITSDCYAESIDVEKSLSNILLQLDDTVNSHKEIKGNFVLPLTATYSDGTNVTEATIAWSVEGTGEVILTLADDKKTVTFTAPTVKTDLKLTAKLSLGTGDDAETLTKNYTITAMPIEEAEAETIWTVKEAEAFKTYTFDYEKMEAQNVKVEWTNDELTAVNASVSSYLKYGSTNLKISNVSSDFYKSYTVKPISCGDYFCIMVKFDETAPQSKEELTSEIEESLKADLLTENATNEMIYKHRQDAKLEIFDAYIEAIYDYQYTYFYETTLKLTDYAKFENSKKKEKTIVARFEVAGQKTEITADQLFNSLKDKYAVSTSVDLINQYQLISNKAYNDIYNPYIAEGTYNKDLLRELLTTEIGGFRKNFELDYFTYSYLSYYGFTPNFPADYGWTNFEKDYFGAFSDEELLTNANFGGSVYSEALDKLTKSLYTGITTEADMTNSDVATEMNKLYNEWYSLNVINLIVYVDANYDSTIDSQTDTDEDTDGFEDSTWTAAQRALVPELIDLILAKASETGETTLANQITALVTLYKNASYEVPATAPTSSDTIYTYNYWAKFKMAGLLLKFETANSYNNSSELVEEFLDELQVMWNKAKDLGLSGTFELPLISNANVETTYGYHKIAALSMTEASDLPSFKDIEIHELVTEATENIDSTVSYKKDRYDTAVKTLKDKYNIEYVKDYAIDEAIKARIDAWYTPAVTAVSGSDVLSMNLIKYLEENKQNIKPADSTTYFRIFDEIIRVSKKDAEANE